MIIANPTSGKVSLVHGNKEVSTVMFSQHGTRNSVQVLEDEEWAKSRNLQRFLQKGTLVKLDQLIEYPEEPESYNELPKWDRNRVRKIVLGTEDEYKSSALFTPYSNSARMPEQVDVPYIRTRLIPVLQCASSWLDALWKATGEKQYKARRDDINKRVPELKEIASENA
jgi:hypothetical protein